MGVAGHIARSTDGRWGLKLEIGLQKAQYCQPSPKWSLPTDIKRLLLDPSGVKP